MHLLRLRAPTPSRTLTSSPAPLLAIRSLAPLLCGRSGEPHLFLMRALFAGIQGLVHQFASDKIADK